MKIVMNINIKCNEKDRDLILREIKDNLEEVEEITLNNFIEL